MRLGAEMGGMDIGAGPGQHHAVDHVQQCPDIGNLGGGGEHQWQRARHVSHRAKIAFSDHLHGKAVLDAMRVADHADYRSPHRLGFRSFAHLARTIMPGGGKRIKLTAL